MIRGARHTKRSLWFNIFSVMLEFVPFLLANLLLLMLQLKLQRGSASCQRKVSSLDIKGMQVRVVF